MPRFRDYHDQYSLSDRNFTIHDRVIFIGPPPEEDNLTFVATPLQHKFYLKIGRICYGPSENIRCYPDAPPDSSLHRMFWVAFEGDVHPYRQADGNWLVKEQNFRWE